MRDLLAGQLELRHGRAGDPGGLSNLDLTSGGERQCAVEAASEHVGGGHASADELFDAVGCLDRGVGGVGTGLLRGFGQRVDVLAGVVTGGGNAGHGLVEVRVLAGDQSDGGASCGTGAEHRVGDLAPLLLVLDSGALELLPLRPDTTELLCGTGALADRDADLLGQVSESQAGALGRLVDLLACCLGGLGYVVGALCGRCHGGEVLINLGLEGDTDGTAGHVGGLASSPLRGVGGWFVRLDLPEPMRGDGALGEVRFLVVRGHPLEHLGVLDALRLLLLSEFMAGAALGEPGHPLRLGLTLDPQRLAAGLTASGAQVRLIRLERAP